LSGQHFVPAHGAEDAGGEMIFFRDFSWPWRSFNLAGSMRGAATVG
jgi:hypothetical protein